MAKVGIGITFGLSCIEYGLVCPDLTSGRGAQSADLETMIHGINVIYVNLYSKQSSNYRIHILGSKRRYGIIIFHQF